MKKCGFVSVIGETNSGKSTLVNAIVGQKVSIISRKVQTTLDRILGIAVHADSQIIFLDTPGFFYKRRADNLERIAWNASRESNEILFVVDGHKKNLDISFDILSKIDTKKRVSLVINKIDLVLKLDLLQIAEKFSHARQLENVFMVSALKNDGVSDIVRYLSNIIPEHEWLYDADEVTDQSFDKYVAEITREHLYDKIHHEIPYLCKVVTDHYEQNGCIKIWQTIFVKSESQKKILLGHNGYKIKSIGMGAREELSRILEQKVELFLQIKVNNK